MPLEVVDAHAHVLRSRDHGRELYAYFLGYGPATGHPAEPPAHHTLDEAERLMDLTGVAQMNILMFTWSGRYWRDGHYALPDEGPRRASAREELRRRILARIADNNAWAVGVARSRARFSAFVGIDPAVMTSAEMVDEIRRGLAAGASGAKMIPYDTGVRPDDRRLWPAYDALQSAQAPILSEASGRPGAPSHPAYWREALAEFPRLKLVLSHLGHDPVFGEGADREVVALARRHRGVRSDLSLRLPEMLQGACTPQRFVDHVRSIGVDRVLYGSNFGFVDLIHADPEHDPSSGPQITWARRTLEAFLALPFDDDERAAVASGNWRRLIGEQVGA